VIFRVFLRELGWSLWISRLNKTRCVCICRTNDAEVISIDSDDADDGDKDAAENGRASHVSVTCPPVAWDLSRAALQVEQMVEPRYRTSPLGNSSLLTTDIVTIVISLRNKVKGTNSS